MRWIMIACGVCVVAWLLVFGAGCMSKTVYQFVNIEGSDNVTITTKDSADKVVDTARGLSAIIPASAMGL
jgi:Na+-transporting methylmalonyl-CoA/oxaloacetate decarboxylase gamma subunit